MSRALFAMMMIAFTGGCTMLMPAERPRAVATGDQLAVVDDVKVWTTTQRENVGNAVYSDSSGATVGTATLYADRTHVHRMKVWYPVQGTEQLSDEDFFRITNDRRALDETEHLRATGKKWNRRGVIAIIGGSVAAFAGFAIDGGVAKAVLFGGGMVAAVGGFCVAYWGAQQMDPETHAVDRSIAELAAQRYNAQLGHGVALSRSF